MFQRGKLILLIPILSILIIDLLPAQIKAVQGGLWSDPTTWDLNRKPIPSDEVVIDGHEIYVDEDAVVKSLSISNASGDAFVDLDLVGPVSLIINGTLQIDNETNSFHRADFYIRDQDSVYVDNMVHFNRSNAFSNSASTKMKMEGDARLTVNGDYIYDYGNSELGEFGIELQLLNTSILDIGGSLTMITEDGNGINAIIEDDALVKVAFGATLRNIHGLGMLFNVKENAVLEVGSDLTVENVKTSGLQAYNFVQVGDGGGTLNILGNLNLSSITDNQRSKITVNGATASMTVAKNINFNCVGDEDLILDIEAGAKLYMGGDFNRAMGKFGDLSMEADTRIVYIGGGTQKVPTSVAADSDLDAFQFSNVEFNNTSGDPLILDGPFYVENELILTNGVLQSADWAPVIIMENATVSGGSTSAYVEGPVVKEGAIASDLFIFPTGHNGVYAPFQIDVAKAAVSVEYTAEYLSCPPPLGESIGSSLITIGGTGHWNFGQVSTDGSPLPDIDVTLHWDNANANGITDLADLVVAVYHPDSTAWVSLGNGGTTGLIGNNSGSVINALSCPPPLGENAYAFGSATGANSLPVVLSAFSATTKGQVVEINWETTSEFNSDYFIVERSLDGVNFEEIQQVEAVKNADRLTKYYEKDINPQRGTNYYRLCQVDLMGMKVFSRIIPATFEASEITTVFPNPVRDILHVKGDFSVKEYQLEIYDPSGKLISKTSIQGEDGFLELDVAKLHLSPTGIFFLNINQGGTTQTIPFIKE